MDYCTVELKIRTHCAEVFIRFFVTACYLQIMPTESSFVDKFWIWTWSMGNFGAAIRILFQRATSADLRQFTNNEIVEEIRSAGKICYLSTLWAVILATISVFMAVGDNELAYHATLLTCPVDESDLTKRDDYRPIMAEQLAPQLYSLCEPSVFASYKFNYGYVLRFGQSLPTVLLCLMLTVFYNARIRIRYLRSNDFLRSDNERIPFVYETPEVLLYSCELLVNMIHSPPGAFFKYTYIDNSVAGEVSYDIETLMFILMCPKLYWSVRLLREHCWYHTKSFTVELLSKLNHVDLNTRFAIKLYMDQYPFTILLMCMGVLLMVTSYASRICDRPAQGTKQIYMWDSIWMQIITIATVGFGDFYPITTCSRFFGFIAMAGGITSSALLVTLFSKRILFTPQEFRLFSLTKKSLMNSERKKAAVICMQRMFRAQHESAKAEDGFGWSFIKSFFRKLSTGHPLTSDKGAVRAWITKEWSEQRRTFQSVSNNAQQDQDPLEQVTDVLQSVVQSVGALQNSCDSNYESFVACHKQLEKSEENLERITAMMMTLESLLQSPQLPDIKTN